MRYQGLYYIEWAYQRSRLCRKRDVTTGSICEPGNKCDVNLRLNPYIVAMDLERLWVSFDNDIHEWTLHTYFSTTKQRGTGRGTGRSNGVHNGTRVRSSRDTGVRFLPTNRDLSG